MSKHSPGPWRWGAHHVLRAADETGVITLESGVRPADARLIAAAPELLKLLRGRLEVHPNDKEWLEKIESSARALIRRIEGEP